VATKNNWFCTNLYSRDTTNYNDFKLFIKPYQFKDIPFIQACRKQAKFLHEQHGKLYLAFSGGMDSEFILKTFNELHLPITPILIETPYNVLESTWAKLYCTRNNITVEVISLTGEQFINELKVRTVDRGLPILLSGIPSYISDYIGKDNYLLTGYGDPFNDKHDRIIDFKFTEWDYYLDVHAPQHPSSFFNYSLEVFYSLIKNFDYKLPLQEAKAKLYEIDIRDKIYWDDKFYKFQRNFVIPHNLKTNINIDKSVLLKYLERSLE